MLLKFALILCTLINVIVNLTRTILKHRYFKTPLFLAKVHVKNLSVRVSRRIVIRY